MHSRGLLFLRGLLAVALVAAGTVTPGGSGQTPAPAGASVSGTVSEATGASLDGVAAVIFPTDEARWSGAGSASAMRRSPIADGRFALTGLPPGSYHFSFAGPAALADWPNATSLRTIAAARPMPMTLGPDEAVALTAVLAVAPSAVTIQSATLSRTAIERLPSGGGAGVRAPIPPPGRGAAPPRPTAPGAISGRVIDATGQPVPGVSVASMRPLVMGGGLSLVRYGEATTTDADGRYRLANRTAGSYLVVVQPYALDLRSPAAESVRQVPAPTIDPDGVRRGYVTSIHGGTDDHRMARQVVVGTDEVTAVDVQLLRRPVFDVTGVVTTSLGAGPHAIAVTEIVDGGRARGDARRVAVGADGRFTVPDLPDGVYSLFVSGGAGWAEARTEVVGRSPEPLRMPVQPPVRVSGRVEFRGRAAAPGAYGVPQYGIELRPAEARVGGGFTRVPFRPGGEFTVPGSGPGPFRLQGVAPSPWVQIEGSINGVDTLDLPATVGADATDALVVFADQVTSLVITVRDAADLPMADVSVVVFTEDERYWSARSRRVQIGQTTPSGSLTLTQFPPGRYFVVASREIRSSQPISPGMMAALKPRAIPFDLAQGEGRTLRLRGD